MYTPWPPEAADFCGLSVPSPDGRLVFQGPRVAMAVHEASNFEVGCVLFVCAFVCGGVRVQGTRRSL